MKVVSILSLTFALSAEASGQGLPVFRVNTVEINSSTVYRTEKVECAAVFFEKILNSPGFQKGPLQDIKIGLHGLRFRDLLPCR